MIDWATYGAAIARIVAESGNDYSLAAVRVREQFNLVIRPDSIRRQFQRMRADGRESPSPAVVTAKLPVLPSPGDLQISQAQLAEIIAGVLKTATCQPAPTQASTLPTLER